MSWLTARVCTLTIPEILASSGPYHGTTLRANVCENTNGMTEGWSKPITYTSKDTTHIFPCHSFYLVTAVHETYYS